METEWLVADLMKIGMEATMRGHVRRIIYALIQLFLLMADLFTVLYPPA